MGENILTAGTTGAVRFGREDVDAAIVTAQNAKDKVGEACYREIRGHLDRGPEPVVKGIVSAHAAVRVRNRETQAGLSEAVHTACAPLILDGAAFVRNFSSLLRMVP